MVALVELQEEVEEEEEPVRRQTLLVQMLVVMEWGKKKVMVAKNMQEVGDADADAGQGLEVEAAGELILMGRHQ